MQASCLAYSSVLTMKTAHSSEMSVNFQWTSLRYIPEGRSHKIKQEEMGKHVGKHEGDEKCKTLIGKINRKQGWVDMITLK
jgi:hypothetical protein